MTGLYLHVPFCSQRCVYCDFYFVTTQPDHGGFLHALDVEIEHYARTYPDPLATIYLGGGTPSLLKLEEMARILGSVYEHFDASAVEEVTVEVNPEDVSPEYLRGLKSLGVTRLSIGVQSFFAEDLAWMNRAHDAEQAEAAVEAAASVFDSFSVDLIFGLPEQPFEYWGANLEKAARLGAPHISTYGLTIEPKTPLAKHVERGLVKPSDDDEMAERYQFTLDFLRARGYEHYEVSSFARPGRRAVHNARYWEHENYLGLGPSAHSFWRTPMLVTKAERWANVRNLKRYEALLRGHNLPIDEREPLGFDTLADEYLMLRLRTRGGLDLAKYAREYGVDLERDRAEPLGWLEGDGLLERTPGGILRLTDAGFAVSDAITTALLSD